MSEMNVFNGQEATAATPATQLAATLVALVDDNSPEVVTSGALNILMCGISDIQKDGDIITGVSNGVPFRVNGCSDFTWGRIRGYIRSSGRNQAILPNGCTNSRVAIETIYAVLKDSIEHECQLPDYTGMVGNSMANQNSLGLDINPEWVELVTRGENSAHGKIWRACYNAGVMTVFSALDMRFMAHIRNFQGYTKNLTKEWVLNYPGHWEHWGDHDYYVIAPVEKFLVVENRAAAKIYVIGVTTDDIDAAYEGCVGPHEDVTGEFDSFREVRSHVNSRIQEYKEAALWVPDPRPLKIKVLEW